MEKISYRLDVFEGPLDLLLHLIEKNKLDVYDIPISLILEQFLDYMDRLSAFDIEVASEFVIMAARLLHIKSCMLLPKGDDSQPDDDPRQELVRNLLEYQKYKMAARQLSELYRLHEGSFARTTTIDEAPGPYDLTHEASMLLEAYQAAAGRGARRLPPPPEAFVGIVGNEKVPVSIKVIAILRKLFRAPDREIDFSSVFDEAKSRSEIVAIFLAVLELSKTNRIFLKDDGSGFKICISGGGEA